MPRTEHTDGNWQVAQLREGWYCADYDFTTEEFVMRRCEDIETITVQQARLLSYHSTDDLTPEQRRILFGDEGQ